MTAWSGPSPSAWTHPEHAQSLSPKIHRTRTGIKGTEVGLGLAKEIGWCEHSCCDHTYSWTDAWFLQSTFQSFLLLNIFQMDPPFLPLFPCSPKPSGPHSYVFPLPNNSQIEFLITSSCVTENVDQLFTTPGNHLFSSNTLLSMNLYCFPQTTDTFTLRLRRGNPGQLWW